MKQLNGYAVLRSAEFNDGMWGESDAAGDYAVVAGARGGEVMAPLNGQDAMEREALIKRLRWSVRDMRGKGQPREEVTDIVRAHFPALADEVLNVAWPTTGATTRPVVNGAAAAGTPVKRPPPPEPRGSTKKNTGEVPQREAWRQQVMSADGPRNAVRRVVLMAVAVHMKLDGCGAFPSLRRIAACAHLTTDTVVKHLRIALREGWIERTRRYYDNGSLASYEYRATFPLKLRSAAPLSSRPRRRPRVERQKGVSDALGHVSEITHDRCPK